MDQLTPQTDERLHPSTVWVPLLDALLGGLVPTAIAALFVPIFLVLVWLVAAVVALATYHAYRYLTFRFRVTDSGLILRSGVIAKRERRIPFDRVQEIQIGQTLLQRILGLAKLEISTAGGDISEATLSVISRARAEDLQRLIRAEQSRLNQTLEPPQQSTADYQFDLPLRDVVLGGLTSTLVAAIGALVATILYFQMFLDVGSRWMDQAEQVSERIEDRVRQDALGGWKESLWSVPDLGPLNYAVDFYFDETLIKSLSLALLGMVGSVLGYVIRYYGFRLRREGNLITTSYGLLSHQQNHLPRDRIQTLKIEEGLLRRPLRLVSIRVDSAGDRHQVDEAKNRDMLVPIADRTIAGELSRQAIVGLGELEPPWRRVSRLAIMRGSRKGWLLLLVILLQSYLAAGWYSLALLPGFPVIYLLNYQWYRNTGYWMGETHFLSRRGWLNRSTICLPIKNIQNISLRQNYFDRRLRLATLSIDTAGQSNTGGGPVIRHLPIADARQLQRQIAASVGSCGITW